MTSTALKLSDVVQLRRKLHKMESEAGGLPLGRKLAEAVPPSHGVDSRKLLPQIKPKLPPPIKLPNGNSGTAGGNSGTSGGRKKVNKGKKANSRNNAVKTSLSSGNGKLNRLLSTTARNLVGGSKPTSGKKLPSGNSSTAGGNSGTSGGRKKVSKGKKANSRNNAVKTIPQFDKKHAGKVQKDLPPTNLLPTARALKTIHHKSAKIAKVKKVAKRSKKSLKVRKAKVRKAKKVAKKRVAKKAKKRVAKAVTHAPSHITLSNTSSTRALRQSDKETLALDAMRSVATPSAPKPTPAVTERKLLDLPSQNEFYEQIVNNYYPTI